MFYANFIQVSMDLPDMTDTANTDFCGADHPDLDFECTNYDGHEYAHICGDGKQTLAIWGKSYTGLANTNVAHQVVNTYPLTINGFVTGIECYPMEECLFREVAMDHPGCDKPLPWRSGAVLTCNAHLDGHHVHYSDQLYVVQSMVLELDD